MTVEAKRQELINRVEKLLIADLLTTVKDLIDKASDEELTSLASELEQELFQPAARAATEKAAEAVAAAEAAAQKIVERKPTERRW